MPGQRPAVKELIQKYGHKFKHVFAAKHPVTPKEVLGKGGNITYAARQLEKYIRESNIDPLNVIVTTLDSDNGPIDTTWRFKLYLCCHA